MRSDSERDDVTSARRRLASWALLAVVAVVVVGRALEAPAARDVVPPDASGAVELSGTARADDDATPASPTAATLDDATASAPVVDRLTALERSTPRASPRLPTADAPRADALPDAVTRPSLSARYERSFDGGAAHAFWLQRAELRVSWWRPDAGARWDFARHPLDPRRVQAQLSLDTPGVILDLGTADLLDEGLPRAWADASLGGFTVRELAATRGTGRTREAFGLRFEERRALDASSALRELWWNAEAQLALEWRRRTPAGEEHQVLLELTQPAAADACLPPEQRHPERPRVDAIDFRESLSER